MRHINQEGLQLLKTFEGLRLTVYKDVGGLPTVGYGHMRSTLIPGTHITEEDAEKFLKEDLEIAEGIVNRAVTVPITDNQCSALVCFVFNVGANAFLTSTLLHKLNNSDLSYSDAADELLKWNHVNGKVVEGLTQRRISERNLFLKA